MAYIQELEALTEQFRRQVGNYAAQQGLPLGAAYSSYYPGWETQAPQYTTPAPYSLAQLGFRTNSLASTCIEVRAESVSEAPLMVQDVTGDTPKVVKNHPMIEMLQNPCPRVSEQMFWQITELYMLIAGTSYWEKERNNYGEVIKLWPMRPDWCSVIRAQQQPIAYVRYQPYGLPYQDIPADNVVLFQYFDPIYPLLKGFSPTMSLAQIIGVDSSLSTLLEVFLRNNATLGGVINVAQSLDDAEALRISQRWNLMHGGANNAGSVAVFGEGASFQKTASTFKEMDVSALDGRNEARICQRYRVPPIMIAAKVAMSATFNNYAEARKSFYEGPITAEWNNLSSQLWEQLLPDFENNYKDFRCNFDLKEVKALQEDRSEKVNRAILMFEKRVAKLNEARDEIGLTKVDGPEGDSFYENVTLRAQDALNQEGEIVGDPQPMSGANPAKPGLPAPKAAPQLPAPAPNDAQKAAAVAEEKAVRAFIKRRIKEGKFADVAEFECKYISEEHYQAIIAQMSAPALFQAMKGIVDNDQP